MLKAIFSPSFGTSGRAPSFNDFSLRVGEDAESELDQVQDTTVTEAAAEPVARPARTDIWQESFSPGLNSNMKKLGRSYYDTVDSPKAPSVWQNILKAETIRHATFDHFDNDRDGMISAKDLRARLGPNADVSALIAQADKNGDGQIDQAEFCELLKNM